MRKLNTPAARTRRKVRAAQASEKNFSDGLPLSGACDNRSAGVPFFGVCKVKNRPVHSFNLGLGMSFSLACRGVVAAVDAVFAGTIFMGKTIVTGC